MKDLIYLIAAYTSVWVVLAGFIWVLIMRNKKLTNQVDELEERLVQLEKQASGS